MFYVTLGGGGSISKDSLLDVRFQFPVSPVGKVVRFVPPFLSIPITI